MPIYSFVCNDCGTEFEISMSIAEYSAAQSCSCKSTNVSRDFGADRILVDDGNPQTLGMLAEKNAREQGIK